MPLGQFENSFSTNLDNHINNQESMSLQYAVPRTLYSTKSFSPPPQQVFIFLAINRLSIVLGLYILT